MGNPFPCCVQTSEHELGLRPAQLGERTKESRARFVIASTQPIECKIIRAGGCELCSFHYQQEGKNQNGNELILETARTGRDQTIYPTAFRHCCSLSVTSAQFLLNRWACLTLSIHIPVGLRKFINDLVPMFSFKVIKLSFQLIDLSGQGVELIPK